jgi:hypothetical protein
VVEGNSLRATSRLADCSIITVRKLLVDVGTAYAAYQDKALQNLPCKRVASWMVGPRTVQLAHAFIADLASRLADRVQLTTDGHKPYKRPRGPMNPRCLQLYLNFLLSQWRSNRHDCLVATPLDFQANCHTIGGPKSLIRNSFSRRECRR